MMSRVSPYSLIVQVEPRTAAPQSKEWEWSRPKLWPISWPTT